MCARPQDTEYAPYYSRYVTLVPETDVLQVLRTQLVEITELARRVPADREEFRYEKEKWSIREVFGHLIDVERVFGYRAFSIGRGERAPLPSFDENEYIAASQYHRCPLPDLVSEFTLTRKSNLACLECMPGSAWRHQGTASDNPVTVTALVYIIAGHVRHHIKILHSRYAPALTA